MNDKIVLKPKTIIPEPCKVLPELKGKERSGLLYQVVITTRTFFAKARLITDTIEANFIDEFQTNDYKHVGSPFWDYKTTCEFKQMMPCWVVEYEGVCYFALKSQFEGLFQ